MKKFLIFLLMFFSIVNLSFGKNIESRLAFPKSVPLNLRNGPGEFYNVIYILKNKNLGFNIVYRIDNWCFINVNDEYKGWVKCASIAVQKKISFLNKDVSLFRIPKEQKIMKLEKYSKIRIIKCGINWCRISLISNKLTKGWVQKKDIFGFEDAF